MSPLADRLPLSSAVFMERSVPVALSLALLFALPAHAKRPEAPVAPRVPSIEEVVAAEGFTPTPSQSEIYKPGAVLVPNGRGGHDVVVSGCIDTAPDVAVMSQSSIATTLAGGVSARLGLARGEASAGVEKRLSFVDPEQRTISLGKLKPTAECTDEVQIAATFRDLSQAIVLHDVLVAIIKNTVCTRADASGGVVALGAAEAAAFSECVQESDGQVPLGYKAVPLDKVLALAAAPAAPPPTPQPVAVAPTPAAPAVATTTGGFADMGTLDVDARLREQACLQEAHQGGKAAREARLRDAEQVLQAKATAAWQGVADDLQKCLQLPLAERTDCITTTKQWLSAAAGLSAALEAGVETVDTACGPREAAFAAESRQVVPTDRDAATAMLASLEGTDSTVAAAPVQTWDDIEWVNLGYFEVSKTEVTVGQYGACVTEGACTEPDTGGGCNWKEPGRDNHPINCVDWNQAVTFARWAGARLPTGDEWTYAATSGGMAREYPWGNERPSCSRAVQDGLGGGDCVVKSTAPVCSKPAGHSVQGVCDLAGNVSEWTSDLDPSGSYRVFRGGSWNDIPEYMRATTDLIPYGDPSRQEIFLGFRLVR